MLPSHNVVIIDKSGMSLNGVPVLLFSAALRDLSQAVTDALNHSGSTSPSRDAVDDEALALSKRVRFACVDMTRVFNALPETKSSEAEINVELKKKKREAIVEQIRRFVDSYAQKKGFGVVFDVSGNSLNGVPVVTAKGLPDLTYDAITGLSSEGELAEKKRALIRDALSYPGDKTSDGGEASVSPKNIAAALDSFLIGVWRGRDDSGRMQLIVFKEDGTCVISGDGNLTWRTDSSELGPPDPLVKTDVRIGGSAKVHIYRNSGSTELTNYHITVLSSGWLDRGHTHLTMVTPSGAMCLGLLKESTNRPSLAATPQILGTSPIVASPLPYDYADKYLLASDTISPDKRFALIYPKVDVCEETTKGPSNFCRDYLVALQPFQIITVLDTKWPHFQNKNRGGMSAVWSKDSSVVLVPLDSRWGPSDIFLYELQDGRLSRSTNILAKVHELLEPEFLQSRSKRLNEFHDFIFMPDHPTPFYRLEDKTRILIKGTATMDPKQLPGQRAWEARVEAIWDIAQARFTSQKVIKRK
jgi:hypothetical protein